MEHERNELLLQADSLEDALSFLDEVFLMPSSIEVEFAFPTSFVAYAKL
jgi:hypothetical protein